MTGNMIGRVFNDRYKITDRIGIGGMAEVYRAQDNTLGRIVAVKTMLPQYAADEGFTQRFKQEAAAAANLQSPYIVNVYDWGQDKDTYYIVMEFIRGSDLKTAIKERGAINQRKVAEIGSQVSQALSVAHKQDIIHRDIKPQNIMVQPDGNVKVMDFGIARAKNSVMTQTSSVLGTAHYISPEQAQGKELTPASDIYSLGVVLYEAATGKLPFDGPDAVSVAMKQVNEMPVSPREINPDIDTDLELIIMKALSKDPMERFTTANDFKLILNDYLAGRPINLDNDFAAAETALIGGVAPGVDSTSVMSPVNNGGVTAATTAYRAGDSAKKKGLTKKQKIAIAVGAIAALLIIAIAVFALTNNASGEPVPNVSGMTVEEATIELEEAGFKVSEETGEEPSELVAEGLVSSTDPPANERHEEGTEIKLILSTGTEEVVVPTLVGLSADEANKALKDLDLVYYSKAEHSEDIPKDQVMAQDVEAGTKIKKGETVTCTISAGPDVGTVPDVRGQSESSARSTLESAGYKVSTSYKNDDSVNAGNVISQDPSAGASVAKGTTIHLSISEGPAPAPEPTTASVPDYTNKDAQAAASELRKLGMGVETEYRPDNTVPAGYIIRQSHSGTVQLGTTITLVISEGAPQEPEDPPVTE